MGDRREFLKSLAAATAGILAADVDSLGNPIHPRDRLGELLPLRLFGKTGVRVTMLGVGGAHVGRSDEKTAQGIIEAALEGGVRFFDNAESYQSGQAERYYGKYLSPKYRDVSFIMTKSTARDGKTAQRHLEESLKRMKTDYVDLWQIHAITSPSDVDQRIKEGVLEVAINAQKSGKARFIGFTGHTDYKAHLRMLETNQVLQTCQMPINTFDPNYKSFIRNVLPELVTQNYGVIAMKTLANGGFFGGSSHFNHGDNPKIVPKVASIKEALHFVWSLPVSVIVTGAENAEMLQEKIDLAKSFKSMSERQRRELIDRVAHFDGRTVEYYKA